MLILTRSAHPRRQPSRHWPSLCAAGLFALAAACGDASQSGTVDSGGNIVLDEAAVHVVGTSDAIARVQDLEVLADGTVWVLNSVEPLLIRFGAEGELLGAHGQRGGGPEEFGRPAGFVVGGIDGDPWLFDWQRHILVAPSDSGRRELPIPPEDFPQGSVAVGMNLLSTVVRTGSLGEEVILPRKSEAEGGSIYDYWRTSWQSDLVAWNPATGAVRTVVPMRDILGAPAPPAESGGGLPPFPLWYRLWAICGDGEIRVYDRFRNALRGFTPAGVEIEPISLPPPAEAVTPIQFVRATFDMLAVERLGAVPTDPTFEMPAADSARLLNEGLQRLSASPQQLAAVLPRYVDFRCAADGTAWLRPLDLERGGLDGGPAWLRVSPEGSVDRVRLPERFDPYRFTPERIWGVQRDALDVASVAWLPVPQGR